jgi:hypothetical protein
MKIRSEIIQKINTQKQMTGEVQVRLGWVRSGLVSGAHVQRTVGDGVIITPLDFKQPHVDITGHSELQSMPLKLSPTA